jgi:hypothetical protein
MAWLHLEVADVLNQHGDAFVARHRGHLSLGQLKVMSAIRACRTAALGGHVARCTDCDHTLVAYNSCRNRHCPKCQGAAAKQWLADRKADLLPVTYYHVVFTLPAPVADIAYQNKAVVYDLLFRTAAETLITIAADPKHLGARIGLTAVLHTWGGASLRLRQAKPVGEAGGGSALTHHPHVPMIVPGGGLSPDGSRWIACRPGFFLPVRGLSRLFRRLFLDRLAALHDAGRLVFSGLQAALTDRGAFAAHLAPLRKAEWVVYAKRPFGGPEAVLAYLSRYTHRVAISNSRLLACDESGVTFRWKDYRARGKGADWIKSMALTADEFIRRFLIQVLPSGFHRIRHYGLLASGTRATAITRIRDLLGAQPPVPEENDQDQAAADKPSDAHPTLPVLRRPHDRGRDLRTGLHVTAAPRLSIQGRYVMIRSRLISSQELPGYSPLRAEPQGDTPQPRLRAPNQRPHRIVPSRLVPWTIPRAQPNAPVGLTPRGSERHCARPVQRISHKSSRRQSRG